MSVRGRRRRSEFRNWSGDIVGRLAVRLAPGTAEEVEEAVAWAADRGLSVKAVGAGHSFNATAGTDGVQIATERLNAVSIDTERGRAVVGAGVRLDALNRELAAAGLALPNLGDIDRQSVAGAVATATHGTGARLPGLASAVVEMQIVDGSGELIRCDRQRRPDLLRVARVGVGALGIVTDVTLQCVPAFDLHAVETVEPLDEVLEGFDEFAAANDHFDLYWMPGGRRCQVKRANRTSEPRRPQSRPAWLRDKVMGENLAFAALNTLGTRIPGAAAPVTRLIEAGLSDRDLIDAGHRVLVSPRWVRFHEMEYAIDRAALPEAFARVRTLASGLARPVVFPLEVRVSAADDIPLSPAFGRDTAWIAAHVRRGRPYEAYFRGVEEIMDDYGGRPHWGKLHFQDRESLAPRYPEWDSFVEARREFDPDGRFANPYTDRVFGPPGG